VIVPAIGTVVAGVNTRTGETAVPEMLEAVVTMVRVRELQIRGAGF